MWKRLALASVLALAACSSSSDGGGTPVTPPVPVQAWPVVYDLSQLKAPYHPGSIYTTPTTCNRVLQSSLVKGSITLKQDGSAEVTINAWEERPTSVNAPGIPCPTFTTLDRSATKTGTYAISGTGSQRQISISLGGTAFASGPLGATGFGTSLNLSVPGYTVFGIGKPWDPMETSVWTQRS
jgi:hypothetical protein